MKKTLLSLALILAVASVSAAATSLNGEIKLDERVSMENRGNIEWNRAQLTLQAKSEISGQVVGYGELWLYTQDSSLVSSGTDLTNKDRVNPYTLELREAYVDIFAFPFPNVDLRAGKQRIAWGTADKLNPTDNLNPYDFSDTLEFGKKIPTNALKLSAYLQDTTLNIALIPAFTPAVMPSTYTSFVTSYVTNYLPAGTTLVSSESTVSLPDANIKNSMVAARLSRNILGYDMSLSYFSGRDSIPNISTLTLTAVSITQLSAAIAMDYPKVQVIGYDLAGVIGDVGVWAEATYITPENLTQTIVSPLGTATAQTDPYTKYTVGFDYTCAWDFYTNIQLMHGFFDERGADLSNFLIYRTEKKIYNDKVKIGLTWLTEADSDSQGHLFGPQVTLYPADATEIEVGAFSIHGEAGSKISTMNELDQVYFRVKYAF